MMQGGAATKNAPIDLEQCRIEARTLREAARTGDETALERIERRSPAEVQLTDGQEQVAKANGFASWHELVTAVLADPRTYQSPSLECDMVMRGGITSGVVYPRAACNLAARYRFRNIGGASAGAIAAAAVAAAEHGRGQANAATGFAKLFTLPDDLGPKLAGLFQPSPSTKPAFTVLSHWLEPDWGLVRKSLAIVGTVIRQAFGVFAIGFVLMLIPVLAAAITSQGAPTRATLYRPFVASLLWLPAILLIAWLAAAISLLARTLCALPANGFGLCDGHTRDRSAGTAPLTDWLCEKIDSLAGTGKSTTDAPSGPIHHLTFGDLWGAQAVKAHIDLSNMGDDEPIPPAVRRKAKDMREVDLEVMTTNLTMRRPYRFPFDSHEFYFCKERMLRYFPDTVVNQMIASTTPAATLRPDTPSEVKMLCPCHGAAVYSLPDAVDLPVVLAARLSLSFPGLISAVPLFHVDFSRRVGKQTLVESWFSDGGISSNFPIHLFDVAWPGRPTFGITLGPFNPDYPDELVWRAGKVIDGVIRESASGTRLRSAPISSMIGFLSAVLDTALSWVDTTQSVLPGYRDRVVEVRNRPDEGGLNLKMKPPTIGALADRGVDGTGLFDEFDIDAHRWIRYRVMMYQLDEVLEGMGSEYGPPGGYGDLITAHAHTGPGYALGNDAAAAADADATAALMSVADEWAAKNHPSIQGTVPRPTPFLRIVPRQ